MNRSIVLRACAVGFVVAAALAVAALAAFIAVVGADPVSQAAETPGFYLASAAALASTVFLGVGLVGLFLHHEPQLRPLGLLSFGVALGGTMLAAGAAWTYVFVVPHVADAVPHMVDEGTGTVLAGFVLSYAVMAIGWVGVGLSTLRAQLLPRRTSLLLIAGGAITFLPLPSRTLVLALAGVAVARQLRRSATPTSLGTGRGAVTTAPNLAG